jgi:hypothetical protein
MLLLYLLFPAKPFDRPDLISRAYPFSRRDTAYVRPLRCRRTRFYIDLRRINLVHNRPFVVLELPEHQYGETGCIDAVLGVFDTWRRNECTSGLSVSQHLVRHAVRRGDYSSADVHRVNLKYIRANVFDRRLPVCFLIPSTGIKYVHV